MDSSMNDRSSVWKFFLIVGLIIILTIVVLTYLLYKHYFARKPSQRVEAERRNYNLIYSRIPLSNNFDLN